MLKSKIVLTSVVIISLIAIGIWKNSNLEVKPPVTKTITLEEEDDEDERIADQLRREAELKMLRNPATGEIPQGIRKQNLKRAMATPTLELMQADFQKTLPAITIEVKGPNNYGGRTRALGFDVRNSNIIISGGESGGIFRSTNGGDTWARVTPAGQIHNFNAVAQDTRAGQQDTWYAGTGETFGNSASGSSAPYLGYGMLKSTDNGATWTPLAATQTGDLEGFDSDFDFISKIVVNPTNGHVIVAAGEAVFRSTDGGTTWANEFGVVNQALRSDLIYNSVAGKFYAAIHGDDGEGNGGIWESADGDTWTKIRTTAQLSGNGVKRIVLANLANTSGIITMYKLASAQSCGGNSTEVGLQSYNGTTWTDYTTSISDCAGGATSPKIVNTQDGYNMCIATKPNDANFAYFGGTEIYRFNLATSVYEFIGGSQASANAVNLHVDNHLLMFDPNNNDIMWAANDGGLRKTNVTGTIKTTAGDDNGYTWDARNTDLITYQFYDADINPATGSGFVAGAAQDNAFTIHPSTAAALEVGPTADGTAIAILSGTSFTAYSVLAVTQEGGLSRLDNGVETDITPTGKSQDFVGQLYLDADNTEYLYYPTVNPGSGLMRTRIASSISDGSITANSGTGWEELTGVASTLTGKISAMDVTRNDLTPSFASTSYTASDANRKMYIGTDNGKVLRLNDPAFAAAGTTPVDISPSGASGYVSDVSVNPTDDKELLVTFSNYGVPSVWHTSDASIASPTWTNVEGNGPVELASARSAMIVKTSTSTIYLVGTSTGVYGTETLSGSTTAWERIGGTAEIGLALSVEMRLRPSDNKMVLGTHGNGLFMLTFPALLPVELVSFEGKTTAEGNLLSWTTASEENNKGFEIEQSINGKDFKNIGFVMGSGDAFETQSYTYLDRDTNEDIAYYRLKQIDYDANFEYSNIVTIEREGNDKPAFTFYPNPVKNSLTIENGVGIVTVYGLDGKLISTTEINSEKEAIDLSQLPNGTYLLSIKTTDGQVIARQFVKQ